MKLCLHCQTNFSSVDWTCPFCDFRPVRTNGFLSFAPDFCSDAGFKDVFFDQLIELEARNFWFVARNRLVAWAAQRYFPECKSLLEIGCGTGFVLSGIAAIQKELILHGSEISSAGLVHAARRVPSCSFFQMDARQIPFASEFDVIGAFDVLEHIEDDVLVLQQIHQALRPDGGLLLTVPQHQFLWSQNDIHACHVRRYSADDLAAKVRAAGFKIERTSSFVSLLLPLMMLSRWRDRQAGSEHNPLAELKIGRVTNALLAAAMTIERLALQAGVNFPFGGSRLLIARKSA